MAIDQPPPPPARVEQRSKPSKIEDKRDVFARKTPQSEQDRRAAKAFIDGKIEMIRRDPHMTEAEKSAAIADLRARRDTEDGTGLKKKSPK
jgi:hypothetical protein